MCIAELNLRSGGHPVRCLVVGTAKDLQLHPRSVRCGYIRVYTIIYNGPRVERLQLQHQTQVEDVPYALCAFHGQLLASCGHSLRLYDLGQKKLLVKCRNNNFPFFIATIHTVNRRIYVGDLQDSVVYCKHRAASNELVIFADEVVPRHITCGVPLDYDTYFGADKFGNIFASRLPEDANEDVVNPTGNRLLWDAGRMSGAPNKLENVMNFHVGEVVTTCTRTKLSAAGDEVVLLGSVMGSISACMPFRSKDQVDFFRELEMNMRREEEVSLVGREQLSYRSSFVPVKNVVDGDLCEAYTKLSPDRQKYIADEMDATPGVIVKKLEDIRNRIL
jgi:splicing factor 3B subunit 3